MVDDTIKDNELGELPLIPEDASPAEEKAANDQVDRKIAATHPQTGEQNSK